MTTRVDEERIRQEQSTLFLKQMSDMFIQTRLDMDTKYIPRPVLEERLSHLDDVVERIGIAVEKLTGSVTVFHETAPRIYADRVETKQDISTLHTEIEKLKTARETDLQRGYGYRMEDMQGRYQGDERAERSWRVNAQRQGTQAITWVIASVGVIGGLLGVATAIVALILR